MPDSGWRPGTLIDGEAMGTSGSFKPFRHLKSLLRARAVDYDAFPAERVRCDKASRDGGAHDQRLFELAMADVKPLAPPNTCRTPARRPASLPPPRHDDAALDQLHALIRSGQGFRVADTPEYVEGIGFRMPRSLPGQLHRGDFALQAHIDLHGLGREAARAAVQEFLEEAVRRGLRMILIVHGRGLSSPRGPVLKSVVVDLLQTRRWRKWVMAFASARPCDGGAGATYVLLRQKPAGSHHGRPC
jgi:DNA-nicking Smr family endonuclease